MVPICNTRAYEPGAFSLQPRQQHSNRGYSRTRGFLIAPGNVKVTLKLRSLLARWCNSRYGSNAKVGPYGATVRPDWVPRGARTDPHPGWGGTTGNSLIAPAGQALCATEDLNLAQHLAERVASHGPCRALPSRRDAPWLLGRGDWLGTEELAATVHCGIALALGVTTLSGTATGIRPAEQTTTG
jgi:hypothetical protein